MTRYPEALVFVRTADGRFSLKRAQLREMLDSPLFCDAYDLWARFKRYGLGEPIEAKPYPQARALEIIESEWNLHRREKEEPSP